jgi:hypothetical protein
MYMASQCAVAALLVGHSMPPGQETGVAWAQVQRVAVMSSASLSVGTSIIPGGSDTGRDSHRPAGTFPADLNYSPRWVRHTAPA